MNRSVRRLLVLIAVVCPCRAGTAEAIGPCTPDGLLPCTASEVRDDLGGGMVKLVARLPAESPTLRQSLLTVIPAPPSHTLGARLWALVQRGVRLDGTVTPDFDDRPPLPGGGKGRFELAMVGVKIRFGETITTELWGEIVGIELLDHSLTLDGTFRPF
jgi:hypothetical protein